MVCGRGTVRVLTVLLLVLLQSCATLHEGPRFTDAAPPASDEALVYVYRAHAPPLLLSPTISLNSNKIVDLANKGYTNVYVKPGEYTVKSEWSFASGAPDLQGKMSFAGGQTYFVRLGGAMQFATGEVTTRSSLQTVPASIARSEIAECMFIRPEVERVK